MRHIIIALILLLMSCNSGSSAQADEPTTINPGQDTTQSGEPQAKEPEPQEPASQYTDYFNEYNAWDHMVTQCEMGFRVPGTSTHRQCKNYLVDELEKYCDTVITQEFSHRLKGKDTTMWNIIGRIKPGAERRIMLAAHWDTRPTADYSPPSLSKNPIQGANDGASGVAILLELARVFHEHEPAVGVDIVLFDGEDYGPSLDAMFLGSRYLAEKLTLEEANSYNYGILLDMVGDTNLSIHPEVNSERSASLVYSIAQQINRNLGYRGFKVSGSINILDDHIYLIERGIKMYDFIDFEYVYWHTVEDTLDKCHRDSLKEVGHTVENMVYLFPDLYAPE